MSTCHGPHDEERHGRYRDAWEVEGDVRRRDRSTNSMESFLFYDEDDSDDGGVGVVEVVLPPCHNMVEIMVVVMIATMS